MKKTLQFCITILVLSGCSSTAPPLQTYTSNTNSKTNQVCDFDSIKGEVYALGPDQNLFSDDDVYFSRDLYMNNLKALVLQRNEYFESLKDGFKYTGIVTKCTADNSSCTKDNITERTRLIQGELFVTSEDDGRLLQVVNKSCQLAYIGKGHSYEPDRIITRKDGNSLGEQDYKNMYGEDFHRKLEMQPVNIEKDKFNNTLTITGLSFQGLDYTLPYYDNNLRMFRAFGDLKTNKLVDDTVQLYVKLGFSDWATIDRAYDEDSNLYKTLKIDSDAKCSSYGCVHYETVGVNIPISYLITKKDSGFEMKFSGKQSRVMLIPKYLVRQILNGVEPFLL